MTSSNLYDTPQLYDEAFSFRHIDMEVEFLRDAYKLHCMPSTLHTVLELGCGPARHSLQLATAGVKVWALDNNTTMLDYAKSKAAAASIQCMQVVQADMSSFDIKDLQGSLDMAICLLGTFSHMLDNHQAASCFNSVGRHLRQGGLFILELAHPGDLFDGTYITGNAAAEMWEVETSGRKLLVEWGSELDDFDPVSQVLNRTVTINLMKGEEVSDCLLEQVVPYRQYTAQEVDLLATMTGFQVVGMYGEMQTDVDLYHEDAYRLIVCLKKM
eukprot:jgi/Chrzof1/10842/Cz05g14060.t1